jgi:hypothetical protein
MPPSPLLEAIDALEYLLTARLMPEDYGVSLPATAHPPHSAGDATRRLRLRVLTPCPSDVQELADAVDCGEDGDLGVEVRLNCIVQCACGRCVCGRASVHMRAAAALAVVCASDRPAARTGSRARSSTRS